MHSLVDLLLWLRSLDLCHPALFKATYNLHLRVLWAACGDPNPSTHTMPSLIAIAFGLLMSTTGNVVANAIATERTGASGYFGVHIVDGETGRGVPRVKLTTTTNEYFITDSGGWAAVITLGCVLHVQHTHAMHALILRSSHAPHHTRQCSCV